MVHESMSDVLLLKSEFMYMIQLSDAYYYCKKGVLVVHESDVRCIITVRKKGVLVVHESDVNTLL